MSVVVRCLVYALFGLWIVCCCFGFGRCACVLYDDCGLLRVVVLFAVGRALSGVRFCLCVVARCEWFMVVRCVLFVACGLLFVDLCVDCVLRGVCWLLVVVWCS